MPLSSNEDARRRQLANLTRRHGAPPLNQRAVRHGFHSEVLVRDVEAEVRELQDALADAAPLRDADGSLPVHDVIAVEVAARALKRYRHVCGWLDLHGRVDEKGAVKPAAELEIRAENQLHRALDALGMSPASRGRLGLSLAATFDLAQHWAREAEEADGA